LKLCARSETGKRKRRSSIARYGGIRRTEFATRTNLQYLE
jgi:hypothetical protein